MLSKNNHNLKIKQASDRQLRFSLRKFGTGIASVAIASLFFIGSSAMTVHADTSDGSTTTVLTANSTNQSTTVADALTQSAAASDSAAQSTTADNAKDQASTATDSANTATSTNSSTAQSTEADQTIINSKQNSTQAPATDNIQHGINITANNQTTGYNGSSILNANQSDGTFDVNTVVTNNNSDSRKVEEIVLLPTFTANNSTDSNTPVVTVKTSPMNNRQNTAKTSQKTLPQTGNEQTGLLAALGLGLSSLALSLTGAFKKRHN